MVSLQFSTTINASAEKVWFSLWNKTDYENWVSVFYEGSYAISDWNKGSKVHFLSPEGSGMFSVISEMIPNKKITFLHQGEVKEHIEQEPKKEWIGCEESYELIEENGVTTLTVNLLLDKNWKDYFNDTFPKALAKIKEIAENDKTETITVQAFINKPVAEVWDFYTKPEHIVKWNFASEDWHCPRAENDAQTGGKFSYRMEAKDGSMGFDFEGEYSEVILHEKLAFNLGERKVATDFVPFNGGTMVLGTLEPEQTHSIYLQRDGWQAILNNFKQYIG